MAVRTTPPKTTTGRIFAFLGVLILIGSLVPAPFLVETAEANTARNPNIKITLSDYETLVPGRTSGDGGTVFGIHGFAYVVLEDSSRSVRDVRGVVAMTAQGAGGVVEFDLLETGIGTGIFHGGFGFLPNATQEPGIHPVFGRIGIHWNGTGWEPKPAMVRVDSNTKTSITVGVKGDTKSTTFTWFPGHSGNLVDVDGVGADHVVRGYNAELKISLAAGEEDALEQLPSSFDTRLLRVFSDSHRQGVIFDVLDDADDDGKIIIEFEAVNNPGNKKLFVQDGDRIYVEYKQPFNNYNEEVTHRLPGIASGDSWVFRESSTPSISIDRAMYFGLTDTQNPHARDRAIVTIIDDEKKFDAGVSQGTVTFHIGNSPFMAYQTGPFSNTFVAEIHFAPPCPQQAKEIITLCPNDRQAYLLSYKGEQTQFTWRALDTATSINLHHSNQVLDEADTLVDTSAEVTIIVRDRDSSRTINRDNVEVRVKSTSDPTNGLGLTLRETGSITGEFRGTFGFTTGSTGGGNIRVADGDWVVVEFHDPLNSTGQPQLHRSPYVQWLSSSPANLPPGDPLPVTDFNVQSMGFFADAAFTNPVGHVSGNQQVHLRVVTEPDGTSGSLRKIEVPVSTLKCHWEAGADEFHVLLRETASGSGVFTGAFRFSQTATCGGASGTTIPVTNELSLKVDHEAEAGFGLFDLVRLFNETSEAPFARLGWWPSGNAEIEVEGNSLLDRTVIGRENFTVTLRDRDARPHIEAFSASAGTNNALDKPMIGGTELVYVTRTDSTQAFTNGGPNTERTFNAPSATSPNPAAEPLARLLGLGQPGCGDLEFEGIRRTSSLTGGSSDTTVAATCISVDADTGQVKYRINCTPSDGGAIGETVTCLARITYTYRAKHVESSPTGVFQYTPNDGEIQFGGNPPGTLTVLYITAERDITVRSGGDDVVVSLAYDDSVSTEQTFVFQQRIWVEGNVTTSGSQTDVWFLYLDPAQSPDGLPGALDPAHFRSTATKGQWRAAQDAVIRVMSPDFSGPAAPITYGDGLAIEVQNNDSNLFNDRKDSIAVEYINNTYRLWETTAGSGLFRGIIDETASDGEAKITFDDPHDAEHGDNNEVETSVIWRQAATATATFHNSQGGAETAFQGTASTFTVRINDADANTDGATLQTITARLSSDSDRVGRTIQLVETGQGTGTFEATGLRFTTNPDLKSDRLLVGDGDRFWLNYVDPLNAIGKPQLVESLGAWRSSPSPVIAWDRVFHIGTTVGTDGIEQLARGNLTIVHPHMSENPRGIDVISFAAGESTTAELEIETLGTGQRRSDNIDMTFVETAPNSGIFIGTLSFTKDANCNNKETVSNLLNFQELRVCVVGDESDVVVIYRGEETSDTATTWYSDTFGFVRFDQIGYGQFRSPIRVIVYDDASNPTGEVRVRSAADTEGIKVPLAGGSGIFVGTIEADRQSSSETNKRLHVNDDDELTAEYTTAGQTRAATARFLEGLDLDGPPTSRINVSPIGNVCEGQGGWFLCPVEITFEPVNRLIEHVQRVSYTVSGPVELSGTFDPSAPTALTLGQNPDNEGIYEISFRTTDTLGRPGPLVTEEVKLSLKNPTAAVAAGSLATESLPAGRVSVSWEPIEGKTQPLVFGQYRVFRSADGTSQNVTLAGNATTESLTDLPPVDEPSQLGETFTYFVRVVNEAGRLGPLSAGVEGLSDRVAPRLASFNVSATELHEELGENTINTTLILEGDAENLQDTQEVILRIIDPFGELEAEIEMEPQGDNLTYAASYTEFDTCGVYRVLGVAIDAVGNEGIGNQSVRYVGIDREPPQLQGLTKDQVVEIQQGQPFNVTVVDNCSGVASVSYTINDGEPRDVTIPQRQEGDNCTPGPCEVNFQIPAARLQIGDNTIVFSLADRNETANIATWTITVRMVVPEVPEEEDPLAPLVIDRDEFSSLVEFGGTFRFQVTGTVTDVTFATETLDLGSVFGGFSPTTGRVSVDVSDLSAGGPHTASITVRNAFGSDDVEFTFFVLDEGIPLPPINVQVTKDSAGRPVVSWQPNPDSQVDVGGYLIHRSSSPWRVIGVAGAEETSFTDLTALGRTQYQYAVTAYGAGGQGLLSIGDDSEGFPWFQGVRGTTFQTDDIGEGIPPILLWVVLVVLAVLVVVGLLYATRRQIFGRGDEELYTEDYPDEAETPFGEERHLISCPNCSTEFHVNGERPVVTNCPNCGRKGILR
jgi:hypothetical protein